MRPHDAPLPMAQLEKLFGDPFEPGNPTGFAQIVAADEQEDLCEAATHLLDAFGLNAELVPVEHGGRLARVDDLVELLRSVCRRDPAMAIGHATGSLRSAAHVWTAGSPGQCAEMAALLLGNGTAAYAHHDLPYGTDTGSTGFTALPVDGHLVLNGRAELVTNLHLANTAVLLARTEPVPGTESHSLLQLNLQSIDPRRLIYLPRSRTVGLRGMKLAGMDITDCPVSRETLLGSPGKGVEAVGRAVQLTRVVLPAMSTAILDTGLRVALRHLRCRTLYGRNAASIPMVRTTLVNAFVDQLAAEALALTAARALHLTPRAGSVYAAAVTCGVSGLLLDAMQQLALAMGSEFYRRDGPHAIFQKLVRDLNVGLGRTAHAVGVSSTVPQLPPLARRWWRRSEPAPSGLFREVVDLPPLDLTAMSTSSGGYDPLTASLNSLPDRVATGCPSDLWVLIHQYVLSVRDLAEQCAALAPAELSMTAPVAPRDLARRYVAVLAASACVEIWWHHRQQPGFLGRPEWVVAALTRLRHTGTGVPADLPPEVEGALAEELFDRHDHGTSFGISARAYQ